MPETETKPRVELRKALRPGRYIAHLQMGVEHRDAGWPRALSLTEDELQQLVQAAHDQYGIAPQLFAAEPPACNGTSHCPAPSDHIARCARADY